MLESTQRGRSPVHPLVLFMTGGGSLELWERTGILEREVALYRALFPHLGQIAFVSWGKHEEHDYERRLGGIKILANHRGLPTRVYTQALPLLHGRHLRRAAVLKTNQVFGGLQALRAARLFRRPLIARCGYLRSDGVVAQYGAESPEAHDAARYERRLFHGADLVSVTSERMRRQICERFDVPRGDVVVIPNYVDTGLFSPGGEVQDPGSLLFVGRLSEEKNLGLLIESLASLDGVSLTVVGEGPLRGELEELAARRKVATRFLGRVEHENLPAILARTEVFVMPSAYEGHPKALLEAMACGVAVIGTNVQGIREVVRDGETGLLCAPEPADLRRTIEELLADADRRRELGRRAREAAAEYSLHRIVDLELAAIEAVSRSRRGS